MPRKTATTSTPSRPRGNARARSMTQRMVLALAVAMLAGCSSAPRHYAPRLTQVPDDKAHYQRIEDSCRQQVVDGKRDNFTNERDTSAGVGMALGTTLAAGAMAGSSGSMLAAYASATAAAASLFILAPVAMFATARYLRASKEAEIKKATGDCLAANGYTVGDWQLKPAD